MTRVRTRDTDGTPATRGVSVTTWADGWGRYGALVTGARDTDHARRTAAAAIRDRFAASDGWGRGFRLGLSVEGVTIGDTDHPTTHRFRER